VPSLENEMVMWLFSSEPRLAADLKNSGCEYSSSKQFAVIHLEAPPRPGGAFFRAVRNCLRVTPLLRAIRPFSVPVRPSSLQPYSGRGHCPSKLPQSLAASEAKKAIATEVDAIHLGIDRGH
jgi:hypothetical protein